MHDRTPLRFTVKRHPLEIGGDGLDKRSDQIAGKTRTRRPSIRSRPAA
jgi:hypothetical protein